MTHLIPLFTKRGRNNIMSIYWKYINNNELHDAIRKYFNQSRTDPMTEDEIIQIRDTSIVGYLALTLH